jgi:hypothetical protein
VILSIPKEELLAYMLEAIQHLESHAMKPIMATVEDCGEDDVWTFKLTYKIEE